MTERRPFHQMLLSLVGSTLSVHALAFVRHVAIAAYFGISRDMDIYMLAYAIAVNLIFVFGTIFDNISVPRLAQAHEAGKADRFQELACKTFTFSIVFSLFVSVVFIAILPVIVSVIGAGLSMPEQARMVEIGWYFLPWAMICIPYYAMCSIRKAQWQFNRVFNAELIIVSGSILVIYLWHDKIFFLPLAYALGYGLGFLWLLRGANLRWWLPNYKTDEFDVFIRNLGELFGANQMATLGSFISRFIQSYLPSGAIAAFGYSNLLIASLDSLLTFREIFIVPLSGSLHRAARIERIILCISMISLPIMGFITMESHAIIQILFQRGHFDQEAAATTSQVIQIFTWTLWPSMVGAPILKIFQITDRIKLTAWSYIVAAIVTFLSGYLLVFILGYGLFGFTVTAVISSYATCFTISVLLRRCDCHVRWWRVAKYCVYAAAVTLVSALVLRLPPTNGNLWHDFFCQTGAYGLTVIAGYALIRKRLMVIVLG